MSVMTEEHWVALCRLMERDDWLHSQELRSVDCRVNRQNQLETELEAWTREQGPYAVMERLQTAGVPCGVVQTADQVVRDPSLKSRHWWYLKHPIMGCTLYDGPCVLLSRTPAKLHLPAPILGEHTNEVLQQLDNSNSNRLSNLRDRRAHS